MKALSIKQPWAYLLVNGYKDVENRNWRTHFRGEVLVHAGKTMSADDYRAAQAICVQQGIKLPAPQDLPMGCIVGRMEITDCVEQLDSPWFFGKFGFTVKSGKPCKPVPLKGKLSFFETGFEKGDLKWIRKK